MKDEKANLSALFSDLKRWSTEDIDTDELSVTCLRIISILIDDARVHKLIASPLSIIIPKQPVATTNDLLMSFKLIEDSLESHLRGFSRLLENVLETDTVKRDPLLLLESLSDVDDQTLDVFKNLTLVVNAYFDLEEVFSLNSPRIMSAAFLIALSSVYTLLSKKRSQCYRHMCSFIERRVSDKNIGKLFQRFFEKDFDLDKDLAKEFFILSLCFRVAKYKPLTTEEGHSLDMLLRNYGLVGINPFLEAGFLFLNEPILKGTFKDNKQILKLERG